MNFTESFSIIYFQNTDITYSRLYLRVNGLYLLKWRMLLIHVSAPKVSFKSGRSKPKHEEDMRGSVKVFVLMDKPHLFSLGVS